MRDTDRADVRTEFYGGHPDVTVDLDEVEIARSREYALLSIMLSHAPDQPLLERLAGLPGDASPLGLAHVAIAHAARRSTVARVEQEYFNLFVGLGRGELLPYGSYYLTGFLHERPLARLREDLVRLGIERAVEQAEPEDHAAILCEVMSGVVSRRFSAPPGADRALFERHLSPWIGRFFADLECAESADFYRSVGALGRTFIDVETEALALPR
jgi:TorA maturation chaperone TorD